jgi:hypothetical protein
MSNSGTVTVTGLRPSHDEHEAHEGHEENYAKQHFFVLVVGFVPIVIQPSAVTVNVATT